MQSLPLPLVRSQTGFLGSEITKYLVKKNYKVTVFDNNFRGKTDRLKDVWKKIKFIKGDIRNKIQVYNATKNIPKYFFKTNIKKLCSQIENFVNCRQMLILNYAVKTHFS